MNITTACIAVITGNATKITRSEYHNNKLCTFTYVNDIRFDTKKFNIAMIVAKETLNIMINEYPTRKLLTERIIDSRSRAKHLSDEVFNLIQKKAEVASHVNSLRDQVSLLSSQKETLTAQQTIGSDSPSSQMRYIIFSQQEEGGDDVWKFHFASRHTSHTALLEDAKNTYGRDISQVSGGFYSRRSANGLKSTFGHSVGARSLDKYTVDIILYGRSDSFGLRLDDLSEAIEQYQRDHETTKFTVLD